MEATRLASLRGEFKSLQALHDCPDFRWAVDSLFFLSDIDNAREGCMEESVYNAAIHAWSILILAGANGLHVDRWRRGLDYIGEGSRFRANIKSPFIA